MVSFVMADKVGTCAESCGCLVYVMLWQLRIGKVVLGGSGSVSSGN